MCYIRIYTYTVHEQYYFAKTPKDTYRTGEPPELYVRRFETPCEAFQDRPWWSWLQVCGSTSEDTHATCGLQEGEFHSARGDVPEHLVRNLYLCRWQMVGAESQRWRLRGCPAGVLWTERPDVGILSFHTLCRDEPTEKRENVFPYLFIFDLMGGAEQVCIEGNLPSSATSIKLDLATLPCARPLFPEAEEEQKPGGEARFPTGSRVGNCLVSGHEFTTAGNQTWQIHSKWAFRSENHWTKWNIVQLAMFDDWRVYVYSYILYNLV